MQNIFDQLNKIQDYYAKLPQHLQHSFLPCFLASVPMIFASLFSAYATMPFVIAITIYLLYQVTRYTDTFVFTLTSQECRTRITLPLVALIPVWGIAIAWFSRKEMLLGIVGPYIALLLLCVAPAYRIKQSRLTRYIPLEISFTVLAFITVAASLNYINH